MKLNEVSIQKKTNPWQTPRFSNTVYEGLEMRPRFELFIPVRANTWFMPSPMTVGLSCSSLSDDSRFSRMAWNTIAEIDANYYSPNQ